MGNLTKVIGTSFTLALICLPLALAQGAPGVTWAKNVKALGALSVADNGDVVFIGSDAKLRRLDSTGKEKWAYALGDVGRAQPIVTPQGLTLVAAYDDALQAVDLSGQKVWSLKLDGDIYASPALRPDGSVVVASSGGMVYAVSAGGQVLWSYKVGVPIYSSPVLDAQGNIYLGTQGNALLSLSAAGQLRWAFRTGSTVFSSPALDGVGNVYFGSGDKKIYSLTSAGELRWAKQTASFVNASPIVTASGLVVVGSYDGNVYALTSAGQDAWVYPAGAAVAAPAVELAGGVVVVGDMSGTLHAIAPNGKAQWKLKVGDRIDTSVNVSLQGQLYIETADGKLSVLTNQAPLASGPWSFYRSVGAGYGRVLDAQEAAALANLKRPAAQKALALAGKAPVTASLPPASTSASAPTAPALPSTPPPLAQSVGQPLTGAPVVPTVVDPAAQARAAAAQARVQGGRVVVPLSETLGALGAQVLVSTPQSVTLKLPPSLANATATLPVQLLTVGGKRSPWVAVGDLKAVPGSSVHYQQGVYTWQVGALPVALKLDLPLVKLLNFKAGQEFPNVVNKG